MLLDDPLSAVDAHVADWLLRHAICGPLMHGRTRIMSTHHKGVRLMESGRFHASPDRGKVW